MILNLVQRDIKGEGPSFTKKKETFSNPLS